MFTKMKQMIIDIYQRILGKQRCVLFSNEHIPLEIIKQYKEIFDKNYMLSKTDEYGKVTFVNPKFLEKHGIQAKEIIGNNHKVVKCGITSKKEFEEMWSTIKSGEPWNGLMSYKDKDNKLGYNAVNIFPIFNKEKQIFEFVSLRNDITKIINLENDIEEAQREMILTLGATIESKSGELKGHVERVAEYSYLLAQEYGLSQQECDNIRIASPLHDSGKIGIPDEILNKPERLNKEEFEIIKTHPLIGYNMFKDSKLELLKVSSLISYEHHEKWDGTGYPRGIKGLDISIYARITALADVFDALAHNRCYKKAWSIEKIDKLFMEERGKHFEPKLVDLYFKNKDKFLEISKNLS